MKFFSFENKIIPKMRYLGRLMIQLFLICREENISKDSAETVKIRKRWFKKKKEKYRRKIQTFFGEIWYWRTYYYSEGEKGKKGEQGKGKGFHPLDQELGLTSDKFSLNVISLLSRLATKMSYASAAQLFQLFTKDWPILIL